jgi:hypothetical protein
VPSTVATASVPVLGACSVISAQPAGSGQRNAPSLSPTVTPGSDGPTTLVSACAAAVLRSDLTIATTAVAKYFPPIDFLPCLVAAEDQA